MIQGPGQAPCASVGGTNDNCSFLSAVDNGWLASGLIVVRNALPGARTLASSLLGDMDFSIFYDDRAQSGCNVNPAVDNQPTGQMYGGYYEGVGPAGYHNGAIYSDPRIAMYIGMGLHQMPGDVWWRTWRTLPPQALRHRPRLLVAGPVAGRWLLDDDQGPAVRQGVPRLGGALHLPGHLVPLPSHLGRRHVRGADGERGRARDDVGSAELRAG